MKNRKISIGILSAFISVLLIAGVAYAAFSDQTKFTGSRFSTGSADLKLFVNLSLGVEDSNLTDELPAPSYDGIYSSWTSDYLLKILNNGTQEVLLTSNLDYLTANDPGSIREVLYVEPIEWNDVDGDGLVENGELGTSFGKKVFTSWKSTGFDFGVLAPGQVKGYVMRFSAGSVTNAKMGQTGVYDFIFNAIGV